MSERPSVIIQQEEGDPNLVQFYGDTINGKTVLFRKVRYKLWIHDKNSQFVTIKNVAKEAEIDVRSRIFKVANLIKIYCDLFKVKRCNVDFSCIGITDDFEGESPFELDERVYGDNDEKNDGWTGPVYDPDKEGESYFQPKPFVDKDGNYHDGYPEGPDGEIWGDPRNIQNDSRGPDPGDNWKRGGKQDLYSGWTDDDEEDEEDDEDEFV